MSRPPYGRKYPARNFTRQCKQRRRRPLILDAIFALLILCGIAFVISHIPQPSHTAEEWTGIATIIDGDTIILNQQRLRLKGIDAPEIRQTCLINGQTINCGVSAKQALQRKIARQTINCTATLRDKYKRFLASCYLGQTDLNQWMVEQGHAVSYYDYPEPERQARANKRGIWASEFQRPQQWRKEKSTLPQPKYSEQNYINFADFIRSIKQAYDRLFNSGGTDE